MAALAERRIIPHEELKARAEEKAERRGSAASAAGPPGASAAARGAAVCGRRCRSTRRRSARGCRRTSTSRRACARCRPNTRRAASTSSASATSGRSAPRRPVVAADQGSGGSEEAVARRDRDARRDRLPPAGDARRGRGNPRRGDVEGHLRRADGDRLDQAARPPQGAGPADHLRHHRGLPVALRPGGSWAICRASRS